MAQKKKESEEETRKVKSPYTKEYKEKFNFIPIVCFITGKRSRGYFQLKTFDGTLISQGVSSKKLKLLEPIKGWLIDWRTVNSSST